MWFKKMFGQPGVEVKFCTSCGNQLVHAIRDLVEDVADGLRKNDSWESDLDRLLAQVLQLEVRPASGSERD